MLQVIGQVRAEARRMRARGKGRPSRERDEEKPRGGSPREGMPGLRVVDAVAHVLLHRPTDWLDIRTAGRGVPEVAAVCTESRSTRCDPPSVRTV